MSFDLGALLRNAAGPAADVMAAHKRRDATLAERKRQEQLALVAAQRQEQRDDLQRRIGESTIARNARPPVVAPDPREVHAANRTFDLENPLPEKPPAPTAPEPLEVTIGANGQRVYTPRSRAAGMTAPSPEPRAEPRDSFSTVTATDDSGAPVVRPFNTRTGEAGEPIGGAKQTGGGIGQAAIKKAVAANGVTVAMIDRALAELERHPDAVGLKRGIPFVGEDINQRFNPEGVDTRALIANVGSAKIHDRTGASMTAKEEPRLMPFIPGMRDTKAAAAKKLRLLREFAIRENQELERSGQAAPRSGGRGGAPPSGAPNLSALRQAAEAHLRAQGKTDARILAELGPPEDE